MKNLCAFLLMIAFLYSCDKSVEEVPEDPGIVVSIFVKAIITDNEYNNRLDPESPSYFGENYIKGMDVIYRDSDGESFLSYIEWFLRYRKYFDHEKEIPKDITPLITPPLCTDCGRPFFAINCIAPLFAIRFFEDGKEVGYTYLRYPDGSEDEIKIQLHRWSRGIETDKIWVNGELAFELRGLKVDGVVKDHFFNPKYYPWMKPLLDDEGNPLDVYMPDPPYCIVLVK